MVHANSIEDISMVMVHGKSMGEPSVRGGHHVFHPNHLIELLVAMQLRGILFEPRKNFFMAHQCGKVLGMVGQMI